MPSDPQRLPGYVTPNSGEWIVVRENGRSARFRNADRSNVSVLVIHVDGGMICEGERADYVVSHPRVVDVIVELKGSDVAKAVRQIRATLPVWRQHSLCGTHQSALVVRSSGIHPRTRSSIERWQRGFLFKHKIKLVVESRNREYEFSEFLIQGGKDAR